MINYNNLAANDNILNSRSNMSTDGYDTLQSPTAQAQHFKRANNRMFVANRGSIGAGNKKMNDDLD